MRNAIADLLRVIAALVVAVGHGREIFDQRSVPWNAALGMCSVMVFFAVSGYSIASEARGTRLGFRDYLLRRLTRLWVVLLPALALTYAADRMGLGSFGPLYGAPNTAVADRLGFPDFLGSVFFLQSITTLPYGGNSPLWSLSFEFWCYIAFYFRRSIGVLIVLALASADWHFLYLAGTWALGAAAAYLPMPSRALSWAVLAALGATLLALPAPFADEWIAFGIVGALSAGLLAFARPVESSAISFLSGSSYSLYAVHWPILLLLAAAYRPASPLVWAFCVAGAVLGAFAFSRATEAHTGRLRRLLAGRAAHPATAEN